MVCEADRRRAAADPIKRLSAMSRIALRICEHPDLYELCMLVYQRIRDLMAVDAFYVALAEKQSEGLHGLLVLHDGREYPPQSLYVPAHERAADPAPVFLSQLQLEQQVALGSGRPPRSGLQCAMRSGGKLLGQVTVLSREPDAYTLDDAQFLQAIVDQLSTAVERDRYQSEAESREAELQTLLDSEHRVHDSMSVDFALRELAHGLLHVSRADGVIVTLWDASTDEGIPAAYAAAPGVTLQGLLNAVSRQAMRGTIEELSAGAAVVHSSKGPTTPRWPDTDGWNSLLTLPLIVEHDWLGIVEVGSKNQDFAFTEHIIATCRVVIQQAAVGIYHARLSEHAVERTTWLSGLAAFTETLNNAPDDLEVVLQLICDEARQLLSMSHTSLFLLGSSEQSLVLRARSGVPDLLSVGQQIPLDGTISLTARAIKERHLIIDTSANRNALGQEQEPSATALEVGRAKSVIAAPMRHNGISLGALLFSDRRFRKGFQSEEIRLALGIAEQAAAAVARSQIRAAEQERLQIASALGRISASIGAEEDPGETFKLILREAETLIGYDQAGIHLFDGSHLTTAAAKGLNPSKLPQTVSRTWRESGVLDLDDCMRDPSLMRVLGPARTADLLSVPLLVDGSVAGRLTLASSRAGRYEAHQTHLATLLAETTAHLLTVMRLREAQKETMAKLVELDEMRRDFVATVSHELRTPLTGILGYVELMLSRWDSLDDGRRKEMLHRTQSSATRLEHLVKDLLLFSNVEHQALRLDISNYAVDMLIEQAAEVMRTKYRGQELDIKHADEPARVRVDAQRAVQVVTNVLDNAIKYSPVGSMVHVRWKIHRHDVEIIVRDHGPGISPESMSRLFTRFGTLGHQPRPGQVGSGIGLYICKKLVEAMNGKIWAASQPGHGSSFHFTLPRCPDP